MGLILVYFLIYISNTNATLFQVSSYSLLVSQTNTKFELTKQLNSGPLLFLGKLGSPPMFSYDSLTSYWNISADFYDSEDFVLNSYDLVLNIPGSISGVLYLAIFSYDTIPHYSIKQSVTSPSLCISSCNNGGICYQGTCQCPSNYGGYDCSVYFSQITSGQINYFTILPENWAFYRLETVDYLQLSGESISGGKFRLFITTEVTLNEVPTMLDSDSVWFSPNTTIFKAYYENNSKNVRVGIFCFDNSACTGAFYISNVSYYNLMWVILFVSIAGFFLITGIPITLIYCKKNGTRNKIIGIKINKEQMEVMFPRKVYNGEKDAVCSVCLDELDGEKLVRELICSHFFHQDCIDEWTSTSVHCPVCKQNLILDYHNFKTKLKNKDESFEKNLECEQEHLNNEN